MSFQELDINKHLLKAITNLNFTTPTPIQEQSIPVLMKGDTDYIGLAQTGTGKTAAFGLPLIHAIDTNKKYIQALILCPTRELCMQISKELQTYAKYMDDLKIVPVYGGVDINRQIKALRSGTHIIVGTPGRLLDHIGRGTISLRTVQTVVLDEADEMLNMGFQEDINAILRQTPQEKNVWLFSATMSKRVEKIAADYMVDPCKVTIGTKNSTAQNLEHQYCVVRSSDRYDALRRIIDNYPTMFGILFCRTRRDTQKIAQKLMKDGYHADALHGDLSQNQRDVVMKKFRNKQLQLLVATDVAARGIDVYSITHVLHYALPEDTENYTHRSGRTARAGKSGISISIIIPQDIGIIRRIERLIGQQFIKLSVPNGSDIAQKQLAYFLNTVDTVSVDQDRIKPYLDQLMQKFDALSKQELVAKFVSMEFNHFLQRYEKSPDLNVDLSKVRHTSYDQSDYNQSGQRLFINLGTKDGLNTGMLLRLICDASSVKSKFIGKIILQDTFSFINVNDISIAHTLVNALNGTSSAQGRKIRIELSSSPSRSHSRSSFRSAGKNRRRRR